MVSVGTMQGIQFEALAMTLLMLYAQYTSARFISDNICLAMPNGQKLPITGDCGSYIVCEYNAQKIQHCSAGTLFDPVAMVCNWAAFVKCGQTPSLPPVLLAPTPSPVVIPTAPTPPPRPSFMPSVPTAPTAAPTATTTTKPTTPVYYPSAPTAPTALPTLHLPIVTPTTRSTVSTMRTTTTTVRPKQTTQHTLPPMDPYPFCTPEEFSFTAHPTACESYYICAYGKLILHSCGHGVYWNTATNQCDFPENTDCTNLPNPAAPENSTPAAETTTISIVPDCYGSDIFYPNYADCSQYYICIGLHPILMSCPTNFLWNSKVSQCESPATAICAQM